MGRGGESSRCGSLSRESRSARQQGLQLASRKSRCILCALYRPALACQGPRHQGRRGGRLYILSPLTNRVPGPPPGPGRMGSEAIPKRGGAARGEIALLRSSQPARRRLLAMTVAECHCERSEAIPRRDMNAHGFPTVSGARQGGRTQACADAWWPQPPLGSVVGGNTGSPGMEAAARAAPTPVPAPNLREPVRVARERPAARLRRSGGVRPRACAPRGPRAYRRGGWAPPPARRPARRRRPRRAPGGP